MEIERKFLIRKDDLPQDLASYPCHRIEQGYLCTSPVVRIRRQDDDYFLTYKSKGLMSREEYNLPLTAEAYEHLKPKADGILITKDRYVIPEKDGLFIDTISGFTATYGNWVSVFTAVAMCCFAFSTIIGWGLYGTRCIEFLFGSRVNKPFMLVYALVAIVGATMDLGLMWSIAETFNGLMAIPNLIAVFLLSGVVVKLVKEYFAAKT